MCNLFEYCRKWKQAVQCQTFCSSKR